MAGGFAHITVVAELQARRRKLEISSDSKRALGMNMSFCEVGAVGPDYPYLALTLDAETKEWANRMHYENTGEPIRAGVRWLRDHRDMPQEARDMALSWLLGYAAHVGTDLTIHPVVQNRVGPYAENATDHRICEMNQDTWVWQRRDLGTVDLSEYFDPIMRNTSTDDGNIAAPVLEMWEFMFRESYPKAAEATPPDINAWHKGYRTLIDAAEEGPGLFPFTRHMLVDLGLSYPSPEEIDMTFIENLETPLGTMHYSEVFDHAINNVTAMWEIIDRAITGSDEDLIQTMEEIPDADLDTGLTFADDTQVFWSAT